MSESLPVLLAVVVAFALAMYVALDGFDLGVGILLLTAREEADRDRMVYSISPVWDANETWIVLAGVTLLGGFPVVYGTLLPAFYVPLVLMLLCLAFRGTAFEFRFQTATGRKFWDYAFSLGSLGASICQGLVAGGLLSGVTLQWRHVGFSIPAVAFDRRLLGLRLRTVGCSVAEPPDGWLAPEAGAYRRSIPHPLLHGARFAERLCRGAGGSEDRREMEHGASSLRTCAGDRLPVCRSRLLVASGARA